MVGEETVRIMNLLRKWSLSLLFPFSILVCNKRSTKTIIQKLLLPSNISPSTLLQALRSLVTTTRITVTANYTSQRVKIGSMYVSSTMVKSSMVKDNTFNPCHLQAKLKLLSLYIGQVIFDSSDYAFAPDILFDPNAPLISNDAALLPSAWHIEDTTCLHDWLQFVRQKVIIILVNKSELEANVDGFMQIFDIPAEIHTQQDTSDELMEVDGEKKTHVDETTSAPVIVNDTQTSTAADDDVSTDMVVDLPEVKHTQRRSRS